MDKYIYIGFIVYLVTLIPNILVFAKFVREANDESSTD